MIFGKKGQGKIQSCTLWKTNSMDDISYGT